MRRIWVIGLVLATSSFAQKYEFKTTIDIEATEVKNQCKTGTCWSFSTTSFLESEFIRMGKGSHDISEMFTVRKIYEQKGMNYVRYHGSAQFSQGSLAHDVISVADRYGIIPEDLYTGRNNGEDKHDHSEMESVLKSVLDVVLKRGKVSNKWIPAFNGVLDSYLGDVPENFEYKGKSYNSKTFAESLGFDADNYVSITSFTHHPFYEQFILEVPDNFSHGSFYNLPLEEFMAVLDHALENGYSVAWDTDVSEKSFSSSAGVAIWPEISYNDMSKEEKEKLCVEILPEKTVTQEMRQKAFDDHTTTDDHLMHITGKAQDQKGNVYYKVKNSWGSGAGKDGWFYCSAAFVQMKSISLLLHKNGLPQGISKKLGL